MATSVKRARSPTKLDAGAPPGKTSKKDTETDPVDEFDDDIDETQLLAAAEAAEAAEAAAEAVASSPASTPSKQPSLTPSKPVVARPAPTPTKTAPIFSKPAPVPTIAEDQSDPLSLERQTMDPEWFQRLEPELRSDYFGQLKRFLASEQQSGKKIYPPKHLIYSWSRLTPLHNVKVVVVGQDPYHGEGQACGLSFSVPPGIPVPPSLRNIYQEIRNEFPSFTPPKHGNLEAWASQGVLLLNACLTVRAANAASHQGKGWERLTKAVLKTIADHAAAGAKSQPASNPIASMFAKASQKQNQSQETKQQDTTTSQSSSEDKKKSSRGVVFLVWGNPAAKTLAEAGITDVRSHLAIQNWPANSPRACSCRNHPTFSSSVPLIRPRSLLIAAFSEMAILQRQTSGSKSDTVRTAESTGLASPSMCKSSLPSLAYPIHHYYANVSICCTARVASTRSASDGPLQLLGNVPVDSLDL